MSTDQDGACPPSLRQSMKIVLSLILGLTLIISSGMHRHTIIGNIRIKSLQKFVSYKPVCAGHYCPFCRLMSSALFNLYLPG